MSEVDSSLVSAAVLTLLRAEMPCPVGSGVVPSPPEGEQKLDLDVGYIVVYLIPAGAFYGGNGYFGQHNSVETLRYQLTSSGSQMDHADLLANYAASVITARDDGTKQFLFDLTIAGHSVMNRYRAGRGLDSASRTVNSTSQIVEIQVHAV